MSRFPEPADSATIQMVKTMVMDRMFQNLIELSQELLPGHYIKINDGMLSLLAPSDATPDTYTTVIATPSPTLFITQLTPFITTKESDNGETPANS